MNTNHKQIKISHEDWETEVDEEIAPLILELHKRELYTYMSCQENMPGYVWILFASFIGAEEFMNIVCDKYSDKPTSLYQRMSGNLDYDDHEEEPWIFSSHVEDYNLSYEPETDEDGDEILNEVHKGKKPDFNFSVSVRFPRSDLKNVFKKLGLKYVPAKQVAVSNVRKLNPKAN